MKLIPQLAGMGPLTQATFHQYTCHRHRRGRLEAAVNAIFTRLNDGSEWEADCASYAFNIVTRRRFSESSKSWSLKSEGNSRGTPTMFTEINEVKGGGGRGGGLGAMAVTVRQPKCGWISVKLGRLTLCYGPKGQVKLCDPRYKGSWQTDVGSPKHEKVDK